jgi:DNA-binding NarL/FixJ family response regulator
MMTRTEILLIDNHPITIEGYINILSKQENIKVAADFTVAYSCEQAYKKITDNCKSHKTFEVAFVGMNLTPYKEKQIHCGIDVAILIRRNLPSCKIILLTIQSEALLVKKVIEKIDPDGFIFKNDNDSHSLLTAYKSIIGGDTYYSPSICKIHNDNTLEKLNFDAIDCHILELISKKIKTKEMPEHFNLSLSAIDKTKATIKNKLLKDKGSDKEIIEEAKKIGLI